MTPTQLTLRHLRRAGWTCGVVERWLPGANVRKDYLGIIDVIAAKPGEGILGVQCTSRANMSSRISKAKGIPELKAWLAAGARFEVWGWEGNQLRIVQLTGADLESTVLQQPARKRTSRWRPADLFA